MIADGTPPLAVDDPVTQYVPSALPGSRAQYVWLERNGDRLSTIDLFGTRFVLLSGQEGAAWSEAAARVPSPQRPELRPHTIGHGAELADPEGRWQELYGVERGGAVLVHPDGYLGQRS